MSNLKHGMSINASPQYINPLSHGVFGGHDFSSIPFWQSLMPSQRRKLGRQVLASSPQESWVVLHAFGDGVVLLSGDVMVVVVVVVVGLVTVVGQVFSGHNN